MFLMKSCLLAFRVQKNATTASVISDAAATLGLDPSRLYVLAEVKESGGEEWILEAGDLPVQRVLLWPRKAQEEHPQSFGFYFLLQVKLPDLSLCYCQSESLVFHCLIVAWCFLLFSSALLVTRCQTCTIRFTLIGNKQNKILHALIYIHSLYLHEGRKCRFGRSLQKSGHLSLALFVLFFSFLSRRGTMMAPSVMFTYHLCPRSKRYSGLLPEASFPLPRMTLQTFATSPSSVRTAY